VWDNDIRSSRANPGSRTSLQPGAQGTSLLLSRGPRSCGRLLALIHGALIASCSGLDPDTAQSSQEGTLEDGSPRSVDAEAAARASLQEERFLSDCDAAPGAVTYTSPVLDRVSLLPLQQGLQMLACRVRDIGCRSPVLDLPVYSPPEGMSLELPVGFEGLLRLQPDLRRAAPDTTHLPTAFWFGRQLCQNSSGRPLFGYSRTALEEMYDASRTSFAAESSFRTQFLERGTLLLQAIDCDGAPLESATNLLDADGNAIQSLEFGIVRAPDVNQEVRPLRVIGGLFVFDAYSNRVSLNLLDLALEGTVGFSGLEPGLARIDVVHEDLGLAYGSVAVEVRAGEVTIAQIPPRGACSRRVPIFGEPGEPGPGDFSPPR